MTKDKDIADIVNYIGNQQRMNKEVPQCLKDQQALNEKFNDWIDSFNKGYTISNLIVSLLPEETMCIRKLDFHIEIMIKDGPRSLSFYISEEEIINNALQPHIAVYINTKLKEFRKK